MKTTFLLTFLALLGFPLVALPQQAMAQHISRECEALMEQINDQVDKLPGIGERIGSVKGQLKNPV